jgi:IclR family pca regulon transcriptional regulator
LEGDEVVMVARALPSQLVPAGVGIGFRLPAYCSALGRVLLGDLPAGALDAYLTRTKLIAVTSHTLTDPAAIRARVEAAKADRFCLVDQEAEHGFRSVAVPLRKFDGSLLAALNIGARVEHAALDIMTGRYLDILRQEAADLTGFLI